MIIYIISALLFIFGAALLVLELIFSITFFKYSGGAGFVIVFLGVYLLSNEISKQKDKIKKKDLGHFLGGGRYGGGDGC